MTSLDGLNGRSIQAKITAQTKIFSKAFRIRIFLFRSYSFGIETINTFIRSRSSLENETRFQIKWAKCIRPVFRPKRPKNHTLWGGTNMYGLYKGVHHPPPPPRHHHPEELSIESHVHHVGVSGQCNSENFFNSSG